MLVPEVKVQTRVFAFLDLEHPPVAWAVMRGMLVSADLASIDHTQGFISFMLARMIECQNNPRIFNEFAIEYVRQKISSNSVSRLRGMYFFGSYEEAMYRVGDANWPNYFRAENLVELELYSPQHVTIVDSDWVTFATRDKDNRIRTDDIQWIENYWKGEPRSTKPIWEYIANGVAIVLNEPVRRRCFAYVKECYPESEIAVLMSRLAGEAGSRGGLVSPFLLRMDNETMALKYLWSDADFHDDDVITSIAKHPDSGYLGRMVSEKVSWPLPDFRPWQREFRIGQQFDPMGVIGTAGSVHHL